MSTGHRFLKGIRQIHLYLGVFTAPMLLFFAFTGGMQTFSLHETTRGSSYTPPAWLATLAQLHKKQTIAMPIRKPHPSDVARDPTASVVSSPANPPADARATATPGPGTDNAGTKPKKNLLPMKIFFALVAVSLMSRVMESASRSFLSLASWCRCCCCCSKRSVTPDAVNVQRERSVKQRYQSQRVWRRLTAP